MPDILLNLSPSTQAVLQRRSETLSHVVKVGEQVSDSETQDFVFFRASNIKFAIQHDWVQEAHIDVVPVFVPGTPKFIRGIVNVRGEIVSAMDICQFLGLPPQPMQEHYQMLRLKHGKLEFGMLCEEIENIQALNLQMLHPFEHNDSTRLNRYLLGLTDDLINVMDAQALLADESLIIR